MFTFLAIHPAPGLDEKIAINITDANSIEHFSFMWVEQSVVLQDYFGFDLPVHLDDNCAPRLDIEVDDVKRLTFCSEVANMSFAEYVNLVRLATEM